MITKRTNPKKHLVALSCATALATFTLVARPAFADEAKTPETSSQPTEILAPAQETAVTNVEVKATTTNPISTNTELPTSTSTVLSEAPSSEVASSELASESQVKITSEQEISNQDNQANKTTPIKTATSEASTTKTSVEKVNEPIPVEETKTPTKNSEQPAPIDENEKPVTPSVTLENAPHISGGHYYSDDNGNWYYKDANGKNLVGLNYVDNVPVYFSQDGIQIKGGFAEDGRYYDKDSGALVTKTFKELLTYIGRDDINGQNIYTTDWYYLDADGRPLKGPQNLGGTNMYFFPNGAQVKGRFAPDGHYYDKDSGALVTNRFVHIYNWNFQNQDGNRVLKFMLTIPNDSAIGSDGKSHFIDMSHYPLSSNDLDREDYYYYVDAKGNKLTGPQTLNGIHVYFDQNGRQLRSEFKFDEDGTVHYYDAKNGARAENTIVRTNTGAFKFDANGNGHLMEPGEETDTPVIPTISLDKAPRVFGGHYYSDNEGNWYYKEANGKNLIGLNFVDNIPVYFDKDGKQVKGQEREIGGKYYRFDENDGSLLTNQWHHTSIFNGYRTEPQYTTYTNYLGEDGAAFIGWHTIDSKRYYFKPDGLLAKNDTVTIDGKIYLFDYQGQLVKNKYGIVETPSMFHANTSTYRTNANGEVLTGKQIIDGTGYVFASDGHVVDGVIGYDGKLYLVKDSKIEKNYFGALFSKKTFWGGPSFSGIYGTDKNGVLLEGIQRGSDGHLHYFQPEVKSVDKPTWKEIDGKRYRLTKSYRTERYAGMYTTIILTNDTLKVDDKTYTIDNEGVVTEFTAKNQFVRDDFWNWYYYDKEGKLLTGRQTIDGVQLYFDKNGKQVKGSLVDIDGKTYYFDKDSGAMWTNTTLEKDGKTYIIDENGVATEKVN